MAKDSRPGRKVGAPLSLCLCTQRRPPQKFHAYLDRRGTHFYPRHDNWPIKTGRERSSYLASDNYTVSSRWFDHHVSTRPREGAGKGGGTPHSTWPEGRNRMDLTWRRRRRRWRRRWKEERKRRLESTIPITWLRDSLPLPLSLSVSPRGLSSPATPPLGPSLSTSCPLLRKSMRPARPLLNPVTHDWNIPRFSAFIRGLFTGTRFYPPLPLPSLNRVDIDV